MSENKIGFRSHYQTEAKQYDQNRFDCTCKVMYDKALKEMIYDYIRECNYILEAGCGTGRFSIYLAKQGKKILAIDASREMLKIARSKAIEENVSDKIEFLEGDIENMPFRDKSFDGAISFAVLRHFNPPENGISELSRIIQNDGVVVFDILNGKILRYYDMYKILIGRKPNIPNEHFFRNYYFNLKEINKMLLKNNMHLSNCQGIIKFPSHLLLCILGLKSLNNIIKWIEINFNFGAVILLRVKRGKYDL